MKDTWQEFKEFISRGNIMDLAVGVIIGGAFGKIVTSFVNDILMPLIGLAMGGVDFSSRFIALDGNQYASLAAAKEAGVGVLAYGMFMQTIIDFLIVAFVLFLIMKQLTRLYALVKKEEKEEESATTKICPFCKGDIDKEATRCPHCTSILTPEVETP